MDYGRHIRLAAATGWWMSHSGAGESSRDHLEIALARCTDPVLHARCLQALGTLGVIDSDPTACLDAADAWHDLGDVEGEFYSAIDAAHLYGRAREGEAQIEVAERCGELAARLPHDPDAGWLLAVVEAEAASLLGHPEAGMDTLRSLLADAPDASWRQFRLAAGLASLELAAHRPAEALGHGGVAIAVAARLGTPLDVLSQATTITAALLQLGRVSDAATAWAVCQLGFDELSWLPDGEVGDLHDAVRASLGDDALAAARREAGSGGWSAGWPGWVRWPETRTERGQGRRSPAPPGLLLLLSRPADRLPLPTLGRADLDRWLGAYVMPPSECSCPARPVPRGSEDDAPQCPPLEGARIRTSTQPRCVL